jgi:cytochrome c-type biogenesis protein
LWDRFHLGDRRILQARPVRLRLAGRTLVTNTVNLAVAVAFAVMGGFVIFLASTRSMTGGPGFQVAIGRGLAKVFRRIEDWTAPVPEPVLGLGVLALAGVFVYATLRDRHRPTPGLSEPPPCHRAYDPTDADSTTTPRNRP